LSPGTADLSSSLVPLTAKYDLPASTFVPLDLKKHTQPAVDRTAYIGAREEVVSLRSMDKITDRRDPETGTALPLRLKDCRARLEVTLKGEPGEVGGHACGNSGPTSACPKLFFTRMSVLGLLGLRSHQLCPGQPGLSEASFFRRSGF